MKELSFNKIKFNDLNKIVNLKQVDDESVFKEWFDFKYKFNNEELKLFEKLIKKHKLIIDSFLEDELKAKVIIPVLNQVDFEVDNINDFYHRKINSSINGFILKGSPDYMVAKGVYSPELPYFFIQEFKKSKTNDFPEWQLLAELLVALKLNDSEFMRGAYIVGKYWYFMILKKFKDKDGDRYEFYISDDFNSMKIEELKGIFKNLQFIKDEILKEVNGHN